MRVAVCEYGAGNVRSVLAAFRRLGADAGATRDPAEVLSADLAVLPGVGSAASAMDGLRQAGLDDALRERVSAGKPTLGICLGLQLALEESEEDGGVPGLGLLPGRADAAARRPRPEDRLGARGAVGRRLLLRALVRRRDAGGHRDVGRRRRRGASPAASSASSSTRRRAARPEPASSTSN